MDLFEAVKDRITTRDAAQRYGLHVSHSGMCNCPFHNDKNPSMRVDKRLHCFGCQADGDVISFTARLFDLSAKDATLKLADDFSLPIGERPFHYVKPKKKEPTEAEKAEADAWHCYTILADYRNMLTDWQTSYAPTSADDAWHPRFIEANQNLAAIEYMLDLLLCGTTEDKKTVVAEQALRLPILARRVNAYREHKPPSVLQALKQPYHRDIPKAHHHVKEETLWNL